MDRRKQRKHRKRNRKFITQPQPQQQQGAAMRIVRFAVNWVVFLTCPIWGGALLFGMVLYTACFEKDSRVQGALAGKEWFWK